MKFFTQARGAGKFSGQAIALRVEALNFVDFFATFFVKKKSWIKKAMKWVYNYAEVFFINRTKHSGEDNGMFFIKIIVGSYKMQLTRIKTILT